MHKHWILLNVHRTTFGSVASYRRLKMMFATLLLQVAVGLSLLGMSALAVVQPKSVLEARLPHLGRGAGVWIFAVFAALAGVATLAGARVPFLVFFSAILSLLVLGGMWVGLSIRGGGGLWPVPATLMAGSLAIGALQPLGLKVLALPKADKLPYAPVPARTVKTYDAGQWFESVRVAPDGTLYLSSNRGDDYATGDKSKAQGQVIARSPDGSERVLFTLPMGSTSGVFAIAADGTIYLTGTGEKLGIWRITPRGDAVLMTQLPRGAWPNGLDFGPDGMLYSADSSLGLIWRIDPSTGHADAAVKNEMLRARPFISLAPGANGIHFHGRDMIVTVSDSTKVLKFAMRDDGSFAAPTVLATGIPGDDFAIGPDGSLYITTHPYNTVVRVAPDGSRSVIADLHQNIVGATDAVFGRTAEDADTLYVATDGGAFQGGKSARGALIALKPFATK